MQKKLFGHKNATLFCTNIIRVATTTPSMYHQQWQKLFKIIITTERHLNQVMRIQIKVNKLNSKHIFIERIVSLVGK